MCHSARCGCYFGGDCNDGPKSRSEIKAKVRELQGWLGWKELYMAPDNRKHMEGRLAAIEWSAYRTKERVTQRLESINRDVEISLPYGQGYLAGLRWVLGR